MLQFISVLQTSVIAWGRRYRRNKPDHPTTLNGRSRTRVSCNVDD